MHLKYVLKENIVQQLYQGNSCANNESENQTFEVTCREENPVGSTNRGNLFGTNRVTKI